MRGPLRDAALARPYRTLIATFVAWKLLLLAIAVGSCIGDAYDTSAALAVLGGHGHDTHQPSPTITEKLATRFASWDAIYFVSVAHRGYRFEQEWAFGSGLPIVLRTIIQGNTFFIPAASLTEFLRYFFFLFPSLFYQKPAC